MTEVSHIAHNFDAALALFTDHLLGQMAPPHTRRAYTHDLTLWSAWLKATRSKEHVDLLERWDVAEYLSFLAKQELQASSIRRKLAAIRRFCSWCVEAGLIGANPSQGVRGPKLREREPAVLTAPEYKALLYEASGHARDLAILQVFLQTGIREGELCALGLADVDLLGKEMAVRGRKGGVDTLIPLNKDVVAAIQRYLLVRPDSTSAQLFLSKQATAMTTRSIRFLVKRYLGRAKILLKKPTASVHTLRHTFGTHKAAKGVPIAQLKYWMGHKKSATTLTYIHLAKARDPELMEATSL